MKVFSIAFLVTAFSIATQISHAHLFQYKDQVGDRYEFNHFYNQEQLTNNLSIGFSESKYIMSLLVTELAEKNARLEGTHYHYSKQANMNVPWTQINSAHEKTGFTREKNGKEVFSDDILFPVRRNMLTFPDKEVNIGESWEGPTTELQDFNKDGISSPTRIDGRIYYTYKEDRTYQNRECAYLFLNKIVNQRFNRTVTNIPNDLRILKVMGEYRGNWYWDKKEGYPIATNGVWYYIFYFANGNVMEFRGNEWSTIKKIRKQPEVIEETPPVKEEDIVTQIEEDLKEKELEFKVTKEGDEVRIDLGDDIFDAASTRLKRATIRQLDKLAQILLRYEHFEMEIQSHMDNSMQDQDSLDFTQKRAENLKDYLTRKGANADNLKAFGKGSVNPLYPNDTDENKRLNRRTEIILKIPKGKFKEDEKSTLENLDAIPDK